MDRFKLTLTLRVLFSVFIIGCGLPLGSVGSFPLNYTPGYTYKYSYSTHTALNDRNQALQSVGFALSAEVHLTPIWSNNGIFVVKIEVMEPRLGSLSRQHLSHELRQLTRSPIYFQWQNGRVSQLIASDDESVLSLNLKRGIISIFQLEIEDGTHSEIDVSGSCRVTYQQLSDSKFKKSKISCSSFDPPNKVELSKEIFGMSMSFSSETEYMTSNAIITTATSHETFSSSWNIEQSVSPTVFSRQVLSYIDRVKSKSMVQAPTVESLLKKLGKDKKGKFYSALSSATHDHARCTTDCDTAAELVSRYRPQLDGKLTGTVQTATNFVRLVQAFRDSSKITILDILRDEKNAEIVLPLVDVVAATQTASSQAALMEFINFNDDNSFEKAERYLLAVSMSTQPSNNTISDLLKLFNQHIDNEKLRESIGDALGAVINSFRKTSYSQEKVLELEEILLNKLRSCKGDNMQCQLATVRAIGNARLPGALSFVTELASSSSFATVSETALNALWKHDSTVLSSSDIVNDVVRKIFFQRANRGYDSTVRSQALRILLSLSTLSQTDVEGIVKSSTDPWNSEYNMYIQACLFDAAKHDDRIRLMLNQVLKNSSFSNYHILAPKGKSLSFSSVLAETREHTATYRMFVENGKSGIMKRSGMDVDVAGSVNKMPVYSFKLYAAGLEGLLGEEVDDNEKEIEVTAGLSLDLLGVSLRPVSFFTGQAGLMSAVWNAPSELTPALQTTILLQDLRHRLNFQNGLIVDFNVTEAVSMSLEGSLSVSLWNKNAHSLIKNRGSLVLAAQLTLATSSFRAVKLWNASIESFIDFQSDVNFYDGVIMCLQMRRSPSNYRTTVSNIESIRGFKTSYRSSKTRSKKINAVSYPLPRRNDENCRKLLNSS